MDSHGRHQDGPPQQINLLTLNCWGLLHISALRSQRIAQIGRELATSSLSSSQQQQQQQPPDVVCLQELFTQADYTAVRRETRLVLPYGKFYHGGSFGAGLAILSRWPIEESSMVAYPLNGRPTAFWRGDWYVGKGVACARIRFGAARGDVLEVFNTHTHAPYEEGRPNDSYVCHRTAQAWTLAKLVRAAADRGHLVAALGDFNMLPLSLAHRLFTSHAPVRDAWRVLHPDSALGPSHHPAEAARQQPVPSADANLRLHGATSNNVTNTWRWSKAQRKRLRAGSPCRVDPDTPDPNGQRLDYIFVSTGSTSTSSPLDPDPVPGPDHHHGPVSGWVIKSASVTMTARHPDLNVSLSDHYAVQATLVRHSSSATATNNAGTAFSNSSSNLLLRGATPSHDSLSRPLTASTTAFQTGAFLAAPDSPTSSKGHRHGQGDARGRVNCAADDDDDDDDDGDNSRRPCHPANFDTQLRYHHVSPDSLPIPLYDEVLAMIHTYAAREQKERRWRGIHFYVSIAVWVACLIAVWFSPANYVSFILVLVASLDLVAGTINGLLALLFFSSEIRALKEFEWEIRNAKAVASGDLVALADGHSPNGKVQG